MFFIIQTNDFHESQNAVFVYQHLGNGKLQHFGRPFHTKGACVLKLEQQLGRRSKHLL